MNLPVPPDYPHYIDMTGDFGAPIEFQTLFIVVPDLKIKKGACLECEFHGVADGRQAIIYARFNRPVLCEIDALSDAGEFAQCEFKWEDEAE